MAATTRYLVKPMLPTSLTGGTVLEYPPTDTLALFFVMEGLWVLPEFIDVERFNDSLSKTLGLFPPVAGRLRAFANPPGLKKGGIYIDLTNSGIPVSVVDDHETADFPLNSVVVSSDSTAPWVDPIPVFQVLDQDEPLVRIRFTRLHKTGEMVYTVSWLHALGDGATAHLFISHIANFYRGTGEYLPSPNFRKVFFDVPPTDPEIVAKFHPMMKHLRDAKPIEDVTMAMMESHQRTSEINLTFSPRQLELLRSIAMERAPDTRTKLSKIDTLVSYLVYVYNYLLSRIRPKSPSHRISTVVNTIDYRGNPEFAPAFMFGNAAITFTCPPFDHVGDATAGPKDTRRQLSQYLWNIAQSIRAGYELTSDSQFLHQYLRFHNDLCSKAYNADFFQYLLPADPGEMTFNSSYLLNWRKAANFFSVGSKNSGGRRNRFHTNFLVENYIRIFPANPVRKEENQALQWDDSLEGGAEAAFCLDRSIAEEFKKMVHHDMANDFSDPMYHL